MAWSETANGQQPWQTWVRVLELCQCQEDRADALGDEIDRLTDAFERMEIPCPRTQESVARFEARLDDLREKQRAAHRGTG